MADNYNRDELSLVLDVFLQTLNAVTIPVSEGRGILDIAGAVMLSERADTLFRVLSRRLVILVSHGRPVPVEADGSIPIFGDAKMAVQSAENPSGPWENVKGPGIIASEISIKGQVAREISILTRAQQIIGFPVARWNALQARRPGGPHQRYQVGDVITNSELEILESVRRLLKLPNTDCWENSTGIEPEQIPPLDRHNGLWVKNTEAAKIESVQIATLASYRQHGRQWEGGLVGRDRYGRVWRRQGIHAHVWYLLSTLKNS